MSMEGMNLAEIRRISRGFARCSQDLGTTVSSIDRLLSGINWQGADAQGFVSTWRFSLRTQAGNAGQSLATLADQLNLQADAQEAVSNDSGANGSFAGATGQGSGDQGGGFFGGISDFFGGAADAIDRGVDWTYDRLVDVGTGVVWVGDKLVDGASAVGERMWGSFSGGAVGVYRMGLAVYGFNLHTLRELSQGRLPQLSEVAAHRLLLTGLAAGTITNVVSGTDARLFAPGTPQVGTPVANVGGSAGRRGAPTDFNSLVQTTTDTYDSTNGVRVTAIRNPGEPPRYVVSVPGTEADIGSLDGWASKANGRNWADNLWGISTGTTGFTQGAEQAVGDAIAADRAAYGEPNTGRAEILLTGHSQGGIIAANMASNPAFSSAYDIRGVVTAGAPIDCAEIPSNIPVLSLQNGVMHPIGDPIPKLDLGGGSVVAGIPEWHSNVTQVDLGQPATGDGLGSPFDNHAQAAYETGVAEVGGAAREQIEGYETEAGLSDFYSRDPAGTTTYDVPVGIRTR